MTITGTEQEDLIAFLDMCPVGILELDNAGQVQRINPEAARVIAATLGVANLQEILPLFESFAPDLVTLTTTPGGRMGKLVEDRLVQVPSTSRGATTISLTLVRISRARLMLVISDQTQAARAPRLESLGQLAGEIAHDFNNLLSVISGDAGTIAIGLTAARTRIGEAQWTSLNDDVEQISSTVERAARLTRRLLAFARQEPIHPEVFEVDATIGGVLEMIDRTMGSRIKVEAELNAGPSRVSMDPGQLDQVLLNLVVNSRKAMPDGGRLTIRTATVQLTAGDVLLATGHNPGQYVKTSVRDTGTGMPRKVLEHAFEPFFTTRHDEGSGLGLSTVYRIITGAGGHVELSSEPGSGTTATFLLPVTPSDPSTGDGPDRHAQHHGDDQRQQPPGGHAGIR